MKKNYNISYLFKSSLFIFITAAAIHSLYDIIGLECFKAFLPMNESIWEHMKMIFYAGLIWAVIEYCSGTFCYFNFWFAKGISILFMVILVPMLFYTYTAFTTYSILWLDILITFIIAFIGQLVFLRLLKICKDLTKFNYLAILVLFILIFLFGYFSYCVPDGKIFSPEFKSVFNVFNYKF